MNNKQIKAAQSEEERIYTVLIRELTDEESRLLNEFKKAIGEKTSSKAMVQLLFVNKRNKEEISSQQKEIERLTKKLNDTQTKLSQLQNQVKDYLESRKRTDALEESLAKALSGR